MGDTIMNKTIYTATQAGIDQMNEFANSQFWWWRLISVLSIRDKLLEHKSLTFKYADYLPNMNKEEHSIAAEAVKHGLLYSAISEAIQSIEDVFSLIKNMKKIKHLKDFTRNVVVYNASGIKKYIKSFNCSDTKYILGEMKISFLDEDTYKLFYNNKEFNSSINILKQSLVTMKEFHNKYYTDYCQYKHGMAVKLNMYHRYNTTYDDNKNTCGCLITYHNKSVNNKSIIFTCTPSVGENVSELYKSNNLLQQTIHYAEIDDIINVTQKSCMLLSCIWDNYKLQANIGNKTFILPSDDIKKMIVFTYK